MEKMLHSAIATTNVLRRRLLFPRLGPEYKQFSSILYSASLPKRNGILDTKTDSDSDLEIYNLTDLQSQHLNPQQQINWCVFLLHFDTGRRN